MSHNAINKGFHAARIVQKRMLSPTVCWIHLDVSPVIKPEPFKSTSTSTLTFEPGQWVDFVVPGLPWVGGFSLVSDPADLPVLSLAVRLGLRPTQQSSKQEAQTQAPHSRRWPKIVLDQNSIAFPDQIATGRADRVQVVPVKLLQIPGTNCYRYLVLVLKFLLPGTWYASWYPVNNAHTIPAQPYVLWCARPPVGGFR